jgi:hypothetical protein
MINLLYALLLVLLTGCNSKKSQENIMDYTFRIPEFSEEQSMLIKKVYPIIIQDLDKPGNYYIAKIEKTNKGIKVIVPNLQILQDGINYRTGFAKATLDISTYVYFFKEDLVSYTRTEADFNDLTEIENDPE